ncbi:Apoptosis regulator Bcl-2 like protein [Argiope bruennichi]|uniref:Apoptosis regulator Bcl-2 like protein n=2 Tax=Argiope bruennichi TaxID=94029 RepID=A0A8T0FDV2_ARGBR|nr:Apoptosis regulator Bcl-2 like protein [Argiope bruennichi]
MAVPVYVAEEIAVGRCVFQNFVHEEFEEEGVPDEILEEVAEEILEENELQNDHSSAAHHYVDENFAHALHHVGGESPFVIQSSRIIGATIREIANEFAQSRERQRIKEEADKVNLSTINYQGFYTILEEVFRQGVNKYNVVALFYFCADVLIKCVKSQLKDIGIKLFKWAIQYIVNRVCAWVARHGGWEKAIKHTFNNNGQYIVIGAAVGICAVGCFILYKWNS